MEDKSKRETQCKHTWITINLIISIKATDVNQMHSMEIIIKDIQHLIKNAMKMKSHPYHLNSWDLE